MAELRKKPRMFDFLSSVLYSILTPKKNGGGPFAEAGMGVRVTQLLPGVKEEVLELGVTLVLALTSGGTQATVILEV